MSDNELHRLSEEVSELKSMLETRLKQDKATRQEAFDSLYAEMKQYKEDWLFKAQKPLLLDLLLFYDSLNWFQESHIKGEMSPDVVADSFQYLIDEFLEVLYRRDVVPVDEATEFDRKTHKVVKVIDTDDPAADYRISQVLKRGFMRAETSLRPEEVVVLRHKKKS